MSFLKKINNNKKTNTNNKNNKNCKKHCYGWLLFVLRLFRIFFFFFKQK